jgi:hypothetical protein
VSRLHTLFLALVQEDAIKSYELKSSPVVPLPRRPLGWSAYHEVEAEFLRVCLLSTVYSRADLIIYFKVSNMGFRNWVKRPMTVRGRHLGVEDLTEGQQGIPVRSSHPYQR